MGRYPSTYILTANVKAHLRDIAGLVPDHRNIVSTAIEEAFVSLLV